MVIFEKETMQLCRLYVPFTQVLGDKGLTIRLILTKKFWLFVSESGTVSCLTHSFVKTSPSASSLTGIVSASYCSAFPHTVRTKTEAALAPSAQSESGQYPTSHLFLHHRISRQFEYRNPLQFCLAPRLFRRLQYGQRSACP